jgi:hypothetical protein
MAAWGHGLLQNEAAQGGLDEIIALIEDDVFRMKRRRPSEVIAGRFAAAVGVLFQLQSVDSFDEGKDFAGTMHAVFDRHEPTLEGLPERAQRVLRDVREGKGGELAARPGKIDAGVRKALFAASGDFPDQRSFGKREPCLFEHPESGKYVQKLADRCARIAQTGFRKRKIACDLCEEGGKTVAALSLLLFLEPCSISASRFREWLDLFWAATAGQDERDSKTDLTNRYRRSVEATLEAAMVRFSEEEVPAEPEAEEN